MCILLKFDYAKFGVSNLRLSNVIKEKPLGNWLEPPPFGTGRVKCQVKTYIQKENSVTFFPHQIRRELHQAIPLFC